MSNLNEAMTTPVTSDVDVEQDEGLKYVTFRVGEEAFATDMAPVQEIIRIPAIFPVPLAPPALIGLSNLRGKVMPIISLRGLLGMEPTEDQDTTRVVVIDLGQLVGFVVDQVSSVVTVAPDALDDIQGLKGSIREDVLTGVLRNVGNHAMVMVLDFGRLIAAEFTTLTGDLQQYRSAMTSGAMTSQQQEDEDSNQLQLVSFTVNDEEYGIGIDQVQEIVQIPEDIVEVPHSPHHLLGLMNLRGRLLPLLVLRRLFGLGEQALDDRSRVVVIGLNGVSAGLVVDGVSEVLRIPVDYLEPLPGLLARNFQSGEIKHLCRLEDGKRVVSIIEADSLLEKTEALDIQASLPNQGDDDNVEDEALEMGDDDLQLVVFYLADNEFAVEIDAVQEIVRVPETLTRVPKTPEFIEGMMNLRGAVLPVIDQRRQLDFQPTERSDRQRVMVFDIRGVRTGFIVDAVTEVLKVASAAVTSSPKLSGPQEKILGRVANLEKERRMIQLIDPMELVTASDANLLNECLTD
ncbi:chemotaxis protein CheW [Marinobacter sediminum]|uniref:chemotaxis protein CheW n=1 Tax=Marinobacter sediminum TaxID=256323 RepID=UPI0035676E41